MKKMLLLFKKKIYFLSFLLFLQLNSFGQEFDRIFQAQKTEAEYLWKNEPFGNYDQSKEILNLRNANTKHFRNDDGTVTAFIAAGSIHYMEKGEWKSIFHTIEPNALGFENLTNNHKTSYPKTSQGNIITILKDGLELKDMLEMRMYFEGNGQELATQTIQDKNGIVDFNQLTYSGIYGNGINLRLTQHTTKRKMDYLIESLSALGNIPTGAEYLIFEEKISLPKGWKATLRENIIILTDAKGRVQANYEKPIFSDTDVLHATEESEHTHTTKQEGKYELEKEGDMFVIKTKVPVSWLVDPERNFPVEIDPTVNYYATSANWWTGNIDTYHNSTDYSANSPMYTSAAYYAHTNDYIQVGRTDTYYPIQSWAKFDITGLTNSCIGSVSLNYRVETNYSNDVSCTVKARLRHLSGDPVTNVAAPSTLLTDIRDGVIYEDNMDFRCYTTGSGWVTKSLNSNLSQLTASIPSGWFGLGFNTFEGGSHTTCYTGIYGHSSTDKPYMTVVYTPNYQVEFSNISSTTFCAGETKNITITAKNVGCQPWTSGWSSPNSVNFTWWANWQTGGSCPGQDCNPRILPFAALAPGASQTITFSVTAPATPGAYTIQTDLVRDGVCWFRTNGAPSCGPGNVDYIIPITVTSPTVDAGTSQTISCGQSVVLNATSSTSGATNIHTANFNSGNNSYTASGGFGNVTSFTNGGETITSGGTGFMRKNSDGDCDNGDAILSSPSFSTVGYSSLSLSFRHYFRQASCGGCSNIYLEGSTNGSVWTTWSTEIGYSDGADASNDRLGTYNNFVTKTIALPAALQNQATVYIRFRYNHSCDWSWSIDDVVVSGTQTTTYAWSPATGLSATNVLTPTATPSSTQTYTLTATSNGCSTTDNVIITVSTPTITGTTSVCHPITSQLSVSNWTNPTGGVVTTVGNDKVHTFTAGGPFTTAQTITGLRVLVVGGGGSGGGISSSSNVGGAGGGGGGGVIDQSNVTLNASTYTVTIGSGATGAASATADGASSVFSSYTALGGGGGGYVGNNAGRAGGCGGGGRNGSGGGTGSAYGFAGGNSSGDAAGGGGATAVGSGSTVAGGNGGAGRTSDISGGNVVYGGGGGGGRYSGASGSSGGVGGGGGSPGSRGEGFAGTNGLGGGGGGASGNDGGSTAYKGGNGGSGIVIIRYTPPTWSSSNTAVATVNAVTGLVTSVGAGTTTISAALPGGCSITTTFTVNSVPSATLTTSSATICHGNTVSLGGNVTASGSWTVNLSSGATASGSGNGTWSAVVSPSATTTYSISSISGSCNGSGTGSTTITLPVPLSSLANHGETATCAVNGNSWIHFYHSSGRYIASILPNNHNLGNVSMTNYVTSPQVMNACGAPSNPLFSTAYMGRSWVMTSTSYPSGNNFPGTVTVRTPFTNAELVALNNHANTATTGNPNDGGTVGPATLANLMMTKITSASTENGVANASDCSAGTIRSITASTGNGATPQAITGASYKEFSIMQFSEMFLHKNFDNSALPVTLVNFSANCPANEVILKWTTASEQNSDKFIVEKSRNMQNWIFVKEVASAGNSNVILDYDIIDSNPFGETSYYRLIQVDLDGQKKIYNPISVSCENNENNGITVFPNPNNGSFTVEIESKQLLGNTEVQIIDMTGKIVKERQMIIEKGISHVLFDHAELQMGVYIVNVKTEDNLFNPVKVIVKN